MNDTTSQKYMPIGVRVLAVLTAGAFLFTSLGAAPAEASFWEERAAARNRQIQSSSAPVLLAQLPASQPLSFGGSIQPTLPSFSPKLSSLMGTAPRWAQGAVTPFADIRSVREGATGSPRVFLVMDAHDVYSAQRNVARLLAHLGNQGKMVVGVEGTSGEFDLERHRGLLPGVGQSQLVDHLLKKGFLNGPEAYGLTAEKMPVLWGVEDSGLYDANVRAYRETLSLEAETKTALEVLKKETLARQAKVYSPELQALDREVQAMHEDRGDMGKYVKAVVEGTGDVRQGSQVRRFMAAKSKEDRLSFPAVEQARAAFIERVSPRLSASELDSLVRQTTAFRAGSMSGKEYYRDLVSLALTKGVPVSAYPAFQSYIEYISLTDGMDVVALMDELEVLEGRAYTRLAKGDAVALTEWTNDLRLAERAVQHAMTPREWDRFEGRRSELARMFERSAALGLSRSPAEVLQTNLPRFAAFFEAATARNNTLLENALAEAQGRGATTVALVTGGFHSPALEKLLVEKKISHMVLTPRIEQIPDSSAGYLQAFAPTRTPLERLLLGDRLFLNPPSATAVSVADPANPFNSSQRALTNAEMAYGAVVASSSGKLEDFLALWNGRFGKFGDAVVRIVKGVTEIRFSNNKRTALLFASTGTGGTSEVAENQLESAITGQGGKLVERGQIGDIQYALGGRNITSIVPESIAALGFVFLYWGSALSPPIYAVGLLGWMVLGGISLRGIFLGSHHLHEMGHALFLQWLGGPSVRKSLSQYGESLSLKQIIPFSNIFIPGLSPAAEAPRMSVGKLSQGWKTRVTALVGPAVNLVAVVLLVPLAMLVDAGSAQSLALSFAGGVNLWMALTSISDYKMAFFGIGDALYCGNLGVLGKMRPQDKGNMPKKAREKKARMWRHIIVRGAKSGGESELESKGFTRRRVLIDKREKLDQVLHKSFRRELFRRRVTGSRPLDAFFHSNDHARYATGGPSEEKNAHPFVWGWVEGFWNALFPRKSRVWAVKEGELVNNRMVVQQLITHNGDFDAWIRRKGESPIPNDGTLARWLTKALGRGDPSAGDSPKIAGMMELLLTQGQWGASFMLAYAMDVADSIDDVMSQSDVRRIGRAADKVFKAWLKDAHVAGCRTLQDMFNQNGATVDELRQELLNATRMDTQGLSQEKKDLLVDRAIHYFFFNDLQESGRFFSDRADGTFGMVLVSSLFQGEVVFGTFKQPMYVGFDPESEEFDYASELASVKAAGEPGNNMVTKLLPFIYFMENGEVAHFKIGEGDIPNSVAFPAGFDFLGANAHPDLSGSEMGGRHSLTVENLERWASQNEGEGGRGWIGTRGNKNLSGGVSVAESDDLVLDTLNDIPNVLTRVNVDWAGENPDSPNLGTADDFADAVLERARVRSLTRYAGDPVYKNQIDVLILGAEYGLYAGEHFGMDLHKVFPGLRVEVVDSKEFALDPENYAVGPNTVVLAISHSGQYFHTVDDVEFLNALHEQGRCGPVFGMAGLIDSVPLGQALGQSYKASAVSNRRLFVTHAGWRLDEPKPVVPLATEITLTHLLVKIAEKGKNKKFGKATSDDTIRRLKEGQPHLQERSESIFGINRKGHKIDTKEHKNLVAIGHHYSQRLTEFLIAMPLAAVHLFVVLYLGGNPVQAGFNVLFSLTQWGLFADATTLSHAFITYWEVPYFIMAYFVAAFLLRVVQRRPLWGRYVTSPTLFLGDTAFVHQTTEAYVRKLFSLSYGWATWGEIKTGNNKSSFLDEAAPSVKRGDETNQGVSLASRLRAMAQMISTQLRSSLSSYAKAGALAVGHEAPAEGKFETHTVLGEEDSALLQKLLGPDPDGARMDLLESRVFSIERLMAIDVVFHANAARTRDWTNAFVTVLRWVAWPLLLLVYVVSFGKFKIPLYEWRISETESGANIFTTQAGKPIAVTVEKFSPRAFHVNGEPVSPRAPPVTSESTKTARAKSELNGVEPSVEDQGKPLPGDQEVFPIRTTRVSRETLLAMASDMGMSPFAPTDSVNAIRKGIWDHLNDSANPVRISGRHEAALFSVLSTQGTGSNSVQIHPGSQLAGEALPLNDYLRQWTSRPVPDFIDVTRNGDVHVTLVHVGDVARDEAKAETGPLTKEAPPSLSVYESDLAALSALAVSLGISVTPSHSIEQLERDIRLKFSLSKTVDVSSKHEKALMLVLSSGEEAYRNRVQVTNQHGESELLTVARFQKGRSDKLIPEWKSFHVVHNGIFLASEVPEKESVGEEEMKQNHLEDVVSLAGFLGLPVGEGDGEDRLADLIENHLKGQETVEIPGRFEEALLFVMFKAQNRAQNRVFSHYWTGRKQGSETLNGFLEMRHGSWTPWESYFVSFVDAMGGVHYFEISPKPMESAEEVSGGQDSPTVEEKPSSGEDRVPESVVESNEESLKSDGKFQTFLERVLRGAARSTGILFVAFLLTSWGGTFTDSLERAATGLFSQPVASAENNSQGTPSPSGVSIPADAPRVFVNTKTSPLISFDKNPAEKIRPVGQLRFNTSVNIVDRQGGYVLVKAPSGLKGWTSSRNVQGEKDGKARVLRNVRLLDQKPAVRMANLAKGTELAVLWTQGKWVHAVPVDQSKKPRWVRGSYLAEKKDVEPSQEKSKSPSAQKTVESLPTLAPEPVVSGVHQLLALMGQPVPILGEMAQRGVKEGFSQNRPGAVLHRRLLAGARLEIEDGPQRKAAMALTGVIDQPSVWEGTERQLVLALGYGAVAGESWAQNGAPLDRPLYDDYRQTRALLNRGTLPAQQGRALTRLARRASRWTLNASPAFGEGSLPVIDLTHAEDETQLLSHWVAALDRASRGGPVPVLIAQNEAQQGRLRVKLEEWQMSHREGPHVLSVPSQWVNLDALGADVAKRDMDGSLLSVRLGALLGAAQVDVRRLLSVDIVSGVQSTLPWDRSDVPENIAVRMIIGFLKELSLTATLDDAKDALRSARKALTAA